jgi:hypothetical protein
MRVKVDDHVDSSRLPASAVMADRGMRHDERRDATMDTERGNAMEVKLQRRVIHGPGWHLNAIIGADGEIQLFDIFIENEWIGSRRTEKQCIQAVRDRGLQVPGRG